MTNRLVLLALMSAVSLPACQGERATTLVAAAGSGDAKFRPSKLEAP